MAVTITPDDLAIELGIPVNRASQLLNVSTALVIEYAPAAPAALQDEAAIRCAGWLAEQPGASIRSESTGDISTSYATNNLSALRHSGAMALLTRWKVRRAGAI